MVPGGPTLLWHALLSRILFPPSILPQIATGDFMGKTKAESQLHCIQSQIGCVVCRIYDDRKNDASIHHIEGRNKEWYTIPLCPDHHQYSEYALHRGRKKFRHRYTSEERLYAIVRLDLKDKRQWPDEIEEKLQDYIRSPYSSFRLRCAIESVKGEISG